MSCMCSRFFWGGEKLSSLSWRLCRNLISCWDNATCCQRFCFIFPQLGLPRLLEIWLGLCPAAAAPVIRLLRWSNDESNECESESIAKLSKSCFSLIIHASSFSRRGDNLLRRSLLRRFFLPCSSFQRNIGSIFVHVMRSEATWRRAPTGSFALNLEIGALYSFHWIAERE